MTKLVVLTAFLGLFCVSTEFPQIFEATETCDVPIESGKKITKITIPSYISVENREMKVAVSLCGKIPKIFPKDFSCINACIYFKSSGAFKTTTNTASLPYELEDASQGEMVFLLHNDLKCNNDDYYEIRLKMVSSASMKAPRLTVSSDCQIDIEMLNPEYEPPCTHVLPTKQLIDLRKLKGKKIVVPIEEGQYKFSLCGSNLDCGMDIAACRRGNETFTIGSTQAQKVRYDIARNQLRVISSIKEERQLRKMEVLLKCDWDVPYFANPKYIRPMTQGRMHKFELDSSFACIKLPSNCVVKDEDNSFTYDLRGLNKKEGYKITYGSKLLILNICGHLKIASGNNCDKQHSQVCEVNGNAYVNRGSIPFFEVTKDYYIRAYFRDGQKCGKNQTYTTLIDIKCAAVDQLPKFISEDNCVIKLLWETPKGCPKFEQHTETCLLSTSLGGVNLSQLYTDEDKIHTFSPSEKFHFNICGNLHSNCSSYMNVTACHLIGNKQQIIGWNSPKLSYGNGKLQLRYFGENCYPNNLTSSLTVNLYCSRPDIWKEPKLSKTGPCTFVANVYSSFACFSTDFEQCIYEDDDSRYDLTALVAKERNYVIKDESNRSLTYHLNICGPVINEGGYVTGNSMIYMMDQSNLHVLYRYSSLGKVARPTMRDGQLIIHSIMGRYCAGGADFETKIIFECSPNNELPKLLQKNGCLFEFIWKTKHACPEKKSTHSCHITTRVNRNITLPTEEMVIEHGQWKYIFNLCSDNYKKCDNAVCTSQVLTRTSSEQNNTLKMNLVLGNDVGCKVDSSLNIVNLTIQCDPLEKVISLSNIGGSNCQKTFLIRTNVVCELHGAHTTRIIDRDLAVVAKEVGVLPSQDNSKSNFEDDVIPIYIDKIHEKHKEASTHSKNDQKSPIEGTIYKHKKKQEHVVEEKVYEKYNENATTTPATKKQKSVTEGIIYEHHQKLNYVVEKKVQGNNTSTKYNITQSPSQICDIGKSTNKFNIRSMRGVEITKRNTYRINFDNSFPNCGGSICKNGIVILPFVENCPTVLDDKNYVKLTYSVPGGCHTSGNLKKSSTSDKFDVEIILKCNTTSHWALLVEEQECYLVFEYYSHEMCDLTSNTNSATIVGVIVSILVIAFVCFISFVIYKRIQVSNCTYIPLGNMTDGAVNHSKLL